MDFQELLKSCVSPRDKFTKPLFILSQHPELEVVIEFFQKKEEEILKEIDKIQESSKELHNMKWEKIENYCLQHGFMTQEEKDKNIGIAIKDGVLFKE